MRLSHSHSLEYLYKWKYKLYQSQSTSTYYTSLDWKNSGEKNNPIRPLPLFNFTCIFLSPKFHLSYVTRLFKVDAFCLYLKYAIFFFLCACRLRSWSSFIASFICPNCSAWVILIQLFISFPSRNSIFWRLWRAWSGMNN